MRAPKVWREQIWRDVAFVVGFGFEAVAAYRRGDVFYTAVFFTLVALMVGTVIGEASAEYKIRNDIR